MILDVLRNVYEKTNKEDKVNHEYHNLKMISEDFFNIFYLKFIKYDRILKYNDTQLIANLKRKITIKLQHALIARDEK